MSVVMLLNIPVDSGAVERVAQEQAPQLQEIVQASKDAGAIHHAFYESDGEVVVIDEWDSPESFNAFFEAQGEKIGQLMGAAGASGQPGPPRFYRKLETGDDF